MSRDMLDSHENEPGLRPGSFLLLRQLSLSLSRWMVLVVGVGRRARMRGRRAARRGSAAGAGVSGESPHP
jgi:hypothetical protein